MDLVEKYIELSPDRYACVHCEVYSFNDRTTRIVPKLKSEIDEAWLKMRVEQDRTPLVNIDGSHGFEPEIAGNAWHLSGTCFLDNWDADLALLELCDRADKAY